MGAPPDAVGASRCEVGRSGAAFDVAERLKIQSARLLKRSMRVGGSCSSGSVLAVSSVHAISTLVTCSVAICRSLSKVSRSEHDGELANRWLTFSFWRTECSNP